MNLYARLPDLRDLMKGTGDATHDPLRVQALNAASEFARTYTDRIFHTEIATSRYNGSGCSELWLAMDGVGRRRADLIRIDSLTVDGVALTENVDYYGWPENGGSYRRLDRVSGTWPRGMRNIVIEGAYSVREILEGTGLAATVADTTSTELTLSASGEGLIDIGDTLFIGSEQVYVEGVMNTKVTVIRAVNGSTAAAHSGVAVQLRRYPADLERAVVQDAHRWLWAGMDGQRGEVGVNEWSFGWPMIKDVLSSYMERAI